MYYNLISKKLYYKKVNQKTKLQDMGNHKGIYVNKT